MNDANKNNALLESMESLFRSGKIAQTRKALRSLSLSKLSRTERRVVSDLARRCDLPLLALKCLRPIVRPAKPIIPKADEVERASYAAALIRIGATEEGLALLKEINLSSAPEASLYRSFAYIAQWDYLRAIPELKRFIKSQPNDFRKSVGQLNLAAALVAEEMFNEADSLLQELYTFGCQGDHRTLVASTLELKAQSCFSCGDYRQCRNYLDEAMDLLKSEESSYRFFTRKWRVIVDLFEVGSDESKVNLETFRQEAIQKSQWETVRECDLYLALATSDLNLFQHVYWGTPFSRYRKKMRRLFNVKILPTEPENRILTPDSKFMRSHSIIKLEIDLEKHTLLDRLFKVLCSDLYRPLPQGELFARMFPGEYFNPHSSPRRLSQSILRLRRIIISQKSPLSIATKRGSVKLLASRPCLMPLEPLKDISIYEDYLQQLKVTYPYKSFAKGQAMNCLQRSKATTHRVLQWAYEKNKIIRSGRGRATLYRFCK